jgi:hypothetical protein
MVTLLHRHTSLRSTKKKNYIIDALASEALELMGLKVGPRSHNYFAVEARDGDMKSYTHVLDGLAES